MNHFIDRVLNLVAPHICKGCGQAGAALCDRCIFYILDKKHAFCVVCGADSGAGKLTKRGNLCGKCAKIMPFTRAYAVGVRRGSLQKLVGDYKYNSERSAAIPIVRLLDKILPNELPNDLTVVPITTIANNIRRRGFDHMRLVGKRLAKTRRLPFMPNLLLRTNNVAQHSQTSPAARRQNAAKSLAINPRAKVPSKILLIDDIFTTGATVETAAKILRQNGAKEIWLAIVVRQSSKTSE